MISVDEKSVAFQFEERKEMTNTAGILHGGVICGMFDDCIGVNFMILGTEYFFPTINLNVEFFSAVKEGETVTVKTNIIKRGKSVINIKADMFNSERIIASATSNLVITENEDKHVGTFFIQFIGYN